MPNYRRPRRLAPPWVQDLSSQMLHSLGMKLRREFWAGRTSLRQDWLLDVVINELEWRAHKAGPARSCVCDLCFAPFPDDRQGDDELEWGPEPF